VACIECARLIAEYKRLHEAYVIAFGATIAASSLSSAEFIRAKVASDDARFDTEVARLELERHRQAHSNTVWG
jgi:hypothetical protein